MTAAQFRARCFGIDWAAPVPLPHFDAAPDRRDPADVTVRQLAALPHRAALHRHGKGEIHADGFRFQWGQVAGFDVTWPGRIDLLPGETWRGVLPEAFYSTVAALTLAGQGRLPLHATAIEIGGKAYLLAGRAGGGKSTLSAELIAAGARLIGDDLSVLHPAAGFAVSRGRPAMRLHPDSIVFDHAAADPAPDDPRGKLLVRPVARVEDRAWPLGGLIILAARNETVGQFDAFRMLPDLLFRPRWCRALPIYGRLRAALLRFAASIPVCCVPRVAGFDAAARDCRVANFHAMIGAL